MFFGQMMIGEAGNIKKIAEWSPTEERISGLYASDHQASQDYEGI
jgi:hypothetical protein